MKIQIRDKAKEDLKSGYWFYEKQSPGLGSYFLESLDSDIKSLLLYAGTHRQMYNLHRCLSKRFPFSIYYVVEADVIDVRAILDNRQRPSRIRRRLA